MTAPRKRPQFGLIRLAAAYASASGTDHEEKKIKPPPQKTQIQTRRGGNSKPGKLTTEPSTYLQLRVTYLRNCGLVASRPWPISGWRSRESINPRLLVLLIPLNLLRTFAVDVTDTGTYVPGTLIFCFSLPFWYLSFTKILIMDPDHSTP